MFECRLYLCEALFSLGWRREARFIAGTVLMEPNNPSGGQQVVEGASQTLVVQGRRSFADTIQLPPLTRFRVPPRRLELINGQLGVSFSDMKMEKIAKDMKFALVLKKPTYFYIMSFYGKTDRKFYGYNQHDLFYLR